VENLAGVAEIGMTDFGLCARLQDGTITCSIKYPPDANTSTLEWRLCVGRRLSSIESEIMTDGSMQT
jgi:hypothetical protein